MIQPLDTVHDREMIGLINMDLNLVQVDKPNSSYTGRRVLHQLPRNPADKSTIVSVFPKEIVEDKPTIFPGHFVIPAAVSGDFSLTIVEGSSYYMPSMVEKMPPTEIQVNSAALALSIINDYLSATWLASKGVRGPGVFWVPGAYNRTSILTYKDESGRTFAALRAEAESQQKAWFALIMDFADEVWARSNGNPRGIPEDARIAAEYLGVSSTKPWMENTVASVLEHCPSCGEMINLAYPTCKHCHAIVNTVKAKELGLVFATK